MMGIQVLQSKKSAPGDSMWTAAKAIMKTTEMKIKLPRTNRVIHHLHPVYVISQIDALKKTIRKQTAKIEKMQEELL